jgi:histidinol phosphatase-like enzyme (inositol monophosphatase family)
MTAIDFAAFVDELATSSGEAILPFFRTSLGVEDKGSAVGFDPVTAADRAAENTMRALIKGNFPEHGIVGEEYGNERTNAEFVWVLDPIDGTKSFITGRPLFGTLIALAHRGRPVLGLIDQSILQERWVGLAGEGAAHNGRPIQVRPCPRLEDAVLFATSPRLFRAGAETAAFERVAERVRLPMFGGDCYAYGLLAMGFADLVVESGLQPYDFMALVPVIEGAGGSITDWQGQPLDLASSGQVIAGGDPRVQRAARELLVAPT